MNEIERVIHRSCKSISQGPELSEVPFETEGWTVVSEFMVEFPVDSSIGKGL